MEEIDLKELFDMFWSRKIVILFIVIIFTIGGVLYTKFMVIPEYMATTTLVLTKNDLDNETITQSEITLNQRLIATYTELIGSNKVLREVISNLEEDISEEALKNSITVKLITNTQLIEISVKNKVPEKAQKFANEITKVFIDKVNEIYKIDNISIFGEAKLPTAPYNINKTKSAMIFAVIGIIIATSYVLIVSMLDTTIKSAEVAEKRLELTVLASIPNYNYEVKKKGKK